MPQTLIVRTPLGAALLAGNRTIRDPEKSGEFITLARVVKTQGRRGEVASEILSDIPDRFSLGMKLLALPRNSASRRELTKGLPLGVDAKARAALLGG